ncbi:MULTISPECIES: restriction endonuclease subunit S [Alphaproteobacteria]|uniref:Type I restriction modification DNA specificity domain-containing protein n=2 Tax=Alphaproteobacteria TaxID=28211 RepID=A0A512HK32_9HYPH|nr:MULTISPECIES: restriction endonuclease subunit S [Alphaproteobacteria]GEO85791.1 hypothetical protein RNA01_27230 [Ciceribacter naphthalenivorans]GLR21647.1 hypothetical protein GCM10007920_14330 [Ciceribacter naphthalenivorans]GLT04503.1 hypothetical protein GCM10007926_14330 [Sphingomonas psychrolutea]
MSELPKGWVEATFADISEIKLGKMLDKEKNKGQHRPYLRNVNVRWDRVALDDILEMRFTDDELEPFGIRDGDLLVCEGGEPGRCTVWQYGPTDIKFQKALMRLRPYGGVDATLLAKALRLMAQNGDLQRHFTGTTIKHLPQSALASISLSLPPLVEQKRIVAKLDALNLKSARARTELARIETLVSRYKQAVLRSAFQGAMTSAWRTKRADLQTASDLIDRTPTPPQPKGGREATDRVIQGKAALAINSPARGAPPKWQWVPLSRISRQETGHTPSRSHPEWWDGEIPWIGIKDAGANHGRIIEETIQTTNEEGLANSAARLLPAGTVCLSRTASVGYVTIMGKPMATSQDFVTWTCTEALVPKFLMYALMAEGDDIREFGKGTTHTTIYFPEVRAMQICLAPLEEQHEIVRRIESAFAKIDRLAKEAKRALELVGRLDEAILAKAFRGELVPQDENDEPAELLLARIRAEHEAAPKVKKRAVKRTSAMLTARDFLNAKLPDWPHDGISFQDLRSEFSGSYDDLKDAVFALLSDENAPLRQVFDEQQSTMSLRRREQ